MMATRGKERDQEMTRTNRHQPQHITYRLTLLFLFKHSYDKYQSVYTFLSSTQTSNVWEMIHLKENRKYICSSYQQLLQFLNQHGKRVVRNCEMLCFAIIKYS